jgi:hypothetical protein
MNPVMKFHVDRYHIPELGYLAVMKTNMTTMQMCTFLIAPYESNVPLASFDLMFIMSKRKVLIEFYDLVGDTQSESYQSVIADLGEMSAGFFDVTDMAEKDGGDGWFETCRTVVLHKQFTIREDARGMVMFTRALCRYLDAARKAGVSGKADRLARLTKGNVGNWKSEVQSLLDKCDRSLENAQEALNGVSSRAGNKLDEVDNLLDRTQELLSRVGVLKDQSEKIMQKLAKGDNSAGLLLQQDSPINKALDKLLLDVDSLLNDIKKNGLDINIDIF